MKFLEKDFIQFIIVVLSGMNNDMFCISVQFSHYPAQLYYFWASAYYCHYFKHNQEFISYSLLISRAFALASSPISSRTKRSFKSNSFIPSTSKRRVL